MRFAFPPYGAALFLRFARRFGEILSRFIEMLSRLPGQKSIPSRRISRIKDVRFRYAPAR